MYTMVCCTIWVCAVFFLFLASFHFKVSFVISQANVLMVLTSDSFTFNFDVMKGERVHRNNPFPDGFVMRVTDEQKNVAHKTKIPP